MNYPLLRLPFILFGLLVLIYNTGAQAALPALLDPAESALLQEGAEVIVNPESLNVTEGGLPGSYTINLTSVPDAPVTINIAAINGEVEVSPDNVSFDAGVTPEAKPVQVTVSDDQVASGPRSDTIQHTVVTTSTAYADVIVVDVAVSIADDDTAGVAVTQSDGSTQLAEGGGTDTYSLVLTSQPEADVVIAVNPDGQATADPSSLTFTSANWDTARTVTITAVNDAHPEASPHESLITHSITSDDVQYSSLAPFNVTAQVMDNDGAIVLTVLGDALTYEDPVQPPATLNVKLSSQPSDSVDLNIQSLDSTEGEVEQAMPVTLTPANWSTGANVAVKGADDDLDDGNVGYTVEVSISGTTLASEYLGAAPETVQLTNQDNDTAGVTITQSGGSTTVTEGGSGDSYTVVLDSEPAGDVIITITPDDQVTTSLSPLTFTTENWNTAQMVTVTAINDDVAETSPHSSDISHSASSTDINYHSIAVSSVNAVVYDNDPPGILISNVSGSQTTEAGGQVTFDVALDMQPAGNVTLSLTSTDTGEGTVSPTSMTFTPGNWNVQQNATIKGIDDDVDDGNVAYNIQVAVVPATSHDGYDSAPARTAIVTNVDNDEAGVTITQTGDSTQLAEAGEPDIYTVVLNSQPETDVVIVVNPDDSQVSVDPNILTFSTSNWHIPHQVTVTAVDDLVVETTPHNSTIHHSASSFGDSLYDGMSVDSIIVEINDNDLAGIQPSKTDGLETSESGGKDTFTVELTMQPASDVIISLNSSDLDEGVVSPTSITFTSGNWNEPQVITITGQDDTVVDGDETYTISIVATSGSGYQGVAAPLVTVINRDNDAAGLILTPDSNLITSENGLHATFEVQLRNPPPPTRPVTVTIGSSDITEGIVSDSILIFSDEDWDEPRTVIITGQDDHVADRDITYQIRLDASSTVESYDIISDTITVVNIDNDIAGVAAIPVTEMETSEKGGSAIFMLTLNTIPNDAVTIELESSDPSEGTISSSEITIIPGEWDEFHHITVNGVDDGANDGHVDYQILITVDSDDPDYAGLTNLNQTVRNLDDDGPDIDWLSPVNTVEGGGILYTFPPTEDEIILEVTLDESQGVQFVYFYRWDIRVNNGAGGHVPIATVSESPYQTVLPTSDLHSGSNQIFVAAVDENGNPSEHKRIILLEVNQQTYLPFVAR